MILIFKYKQVQKLMKKYFLAVLTAILILLCLAGCGNEAVSKDDTFDIVCTVFPQYDWIKSITDGAQNVSITLLCGSSDIHSYQPSVQDIVRINGSDMVIGIGGESDSWVFDSVQKESETVSVNLMEVLYGEAVQQHAHTEDCDHSHTEDVNDEHIWLSVKNAIVVTEYLAELLSVQDQQNSDVYTVNAKAYSDTLREIDANFEEACAKAENNTVVFADRFPFRSLFEDYGINYFAAFPGCSADTDASFDTVISLAEKLDEYSLEYVAVTENTDGKTAKAVIENSNDKSISTVILDSMQSITGKDVDNGVSYVSIMKKNLEAVKKLLG